MKYLSVFSGMEAASVAWEPLGFTPVGFSEIDPFASAILAHRFPNIPNHGDITQHKQWPIEPRSIDILVGGSPCQSFSTGGLRKGLDDPRGHLMLTFLGLADRLRPRWIVWENVPGVLSSSGGRDFGSFIGALGELGYGYAWRILDAQHFGVPQRRRRVFVVATSTGDGRLAGEVLSIQEGLRGYIEAREQKRNEVAGANENLPYENREDSLIAYRKSRRAQSTEDHETWVDDGKSNTINLFENSDVRTTHVVVGQKQARRLMPIEHERLQGFPDNWSRIPWKGKPADKCPDGPRFAAIGNSMAVPVMRWIGSRIKQVEGGAK